MNFQNITGKNQINDRPRERLLIRVVVQHEELSCCAILVCSMKNCGVDVHAAERLLSLTATLMLQPICALSLRSFDALCANAMLQQNDGKDNPRAILTKQQAIEIFGLSCGSSPQGVVPSARAVAKWHGVNETTVRDIWKRRTWNHATPDINGRCMLAQSSKKKVVRPKGSKDRKPRRPVCDAWSSCVPDNGSCFS